MSSWRYIPNSDTGLKEHVKYQLCFVSHVSLGANVGGDVNKAVYKLTLDFIL